MKNKLIYLEWEDAVTNNEGWVPAESAKAWAKEKFGLIRECGWVLEENPEFILLSNRMAALSSGDFDDPDVGGIHKIPKTWIRKRRVLDPFQRKTNMVYLGREVKHVKKTKNKKK